MLSGTTISDQLLNTVLSAMKGWNGIPFDEISGFDLKV
jgi:hypothetical protein